MVFLCRISLRASKKCGTGNTASSSRLDLDDDGSLSHSSGLFGRTPG